MSEWEVECCNCLEGMQRMEAASVDAIVTDPPYGLAFMGKKWDYEVPRIEIWRECLRVLKPGGHLLAFAGTRTQHRMCVNIEDAGFEIRDMIAWVYGSGFPKSHNIGKAIDAACGAERDVIGRAHGARNGNGNNNDFGCYASNENGTYNRTAPATDAAKQWQGWGTALKPAMEPITVARKPLDGTVAENVLVHGTGAINVDGCRVEWIPPSVPQPSFSRDMVAGFGASDGRNGTMSHATGRWPANLIHDGSDEVVGLFPQTGKSADGGAIRKTALGRMNDDAWQPKETVMPGYGDSGSAARFFYCAKASKADRDEGCDELTERLPVDGADKWTEQDRRKGEGVTQKPSRNNHPTVKPTELMRYLCRLVTPPNGLILDPFTGSGSTGKAAMLEGFRFIGFEMSPEYVEIARARIASAVSAKALF